MVAKTCAVKLKGGNGWRRLALIVAFVLWLAVTVVCALLVMEALPLLETAFASVEDIAGKITSPILDLLKSLAPQLGHGECIFLFAVLWLLLLVAWTRYLRTRFVFCRTNAGAALYSGKIGQRFLPGTLPVLVGEEEVVPEVWFSDEDFSEPAKARIRLGAKSVALFSLVEAPAAPAPVEPAPEEIDKTLTEPAVEAVIPQTAVVEPEIVRIIREAEGRVAAVTAPAAPAPVEAPAPVVAEAVAPAEPVVHTPVPAATAAEEGTAETEEEGEDAEEEIGEVREVTVDGKTFRMVIRYSRSFTARVIQAPDSLKNYYSEIKNELMSYSLVKSRISWKHDAFNRGRLQLAKLVVRGKSLCLYLALDPAAYEVEKYHQVDQSGKNAYAKVPMMVRIKSDLGLRKAKFLISEMMAGFDIERGETEDLDYASWYAYRDTAALIEENLIKELETADAE